MRRLLVLTVALASTITGSAQAAISRVSAVDIPFGSGQAPAASSFMSPVGDRVYFGVAAGTGSAFSLSANPLTLPVSVASGDAGENNFGVALRSPDGSAGYFAANDGSANGAKVVKVGLASMTRLQGVGAGFGQQQIWSGGISPDGAYAYWGTWNQDASFGAGQRTALLKFDLGSMSPVSKLSLPDSDIYPTSVLISADGVTGWLGTFNGKVVKVDLAAMTRTSSTDLLAGENQVQTGLVSPNGTYGYFATGSSPAKVVRVNLKTMTRIDAVTLAAGQNDVNAAAISPDGSYGYFATNTDPGKVVAVRLSDMTVTDSLTLDTEEKYPGTLAISPDGQFVYVATSSFNPSLHAIVTKLRVATRNTLTVAKSGSGTVTGSGIDCGADCSISRLDYQDTSIALNATPAAGQVFTGWSGACSGLGTCSLVLNQDQAVTANFEAAPNPPPPGPTPSVSVSSVKSKVTARGAYITSRVKVSGAGKILQRATTGTKKLATRCSVSKTTSAAGTQTLKCNLGSKGRKALKKSALKLTLRTGFTPTGGSTIFANKALTLKRKR